MKSSGAVGGRGSGPSRRIHARERRPEPALDAREVRRRGWPASGARWDYRDVLLVIEFELDDEFVRYRWLLGADDIGGPESVHKVGLDATACNYGGRRPWLLCPECERRVANLYAGVLPPLRCRECAGMRYESCSVPKVRRRLDRAAGIRERLGGEPSLLEPFPPRPTGMHRTTYERLRDEVQEAEGAYLLAIENRAQAMKRRLDRLRASGVPES
jgi:hypothetical protein